MEKNIKQAPKAKETEATNSVENEKSLKSLKYSYEMYEKTKKETVENMKNKLNEDGTKRYTEKDIEEQIKVIENAENAVKTQYLMLGGKEEDLLKKTRRGSSSKRGANSGVNDDVLQMMDVIEQMESDTKKAIETAKKATETKLEQEYIPSKGDYNPEAAFDIIPLPSRGEGYKEKIGKLAVAYLTAYDENMIVSPNLYRDNLILDYIVQEKLLSKEIDPMDLLEGDREAIILFLRASGYGNEYPITATDDITGQEFETIIDLSKLKYKEFKLTGDTNGWFSFILPVTQKEVKFRFPTHRDIVILQKMQDAEDAKIKKNIISNYVETLDTFIEGDSKVTNDEKIKIRQSIRTLEKWSNEISDDETIKFNHTLTNRLNLLVMAVDGITDKKYIYDFIRKMPVKDSSALRKYMTQNEPGIDYNITIERPESLGGGSFTTFLQLDQFIFLNIPD